MGGVILAMLVAGCDGGTAVGTTMPTGPVTTPPEMEQMKNDMQKRLQQFTRYGHKTRQKSAGNKS